jgi:hypothetical protein
MPSERHTCVSQSVRPRLLKLVSPVGFVVDASPWLRASASLFGATLAEAWASTTGGAVDVDNFFRWVLDFFENSAMPPPSSWSVIFFWIQKSTGPEGKCGGSYSFLGGTRGLELLFCDLQQR